MNTPEKYALWLMPGGETFYRLETLIGELSLRHGTPVFPPHMTLLGGLFPPREKLLEKVPALAASLKPFGVGFEGIGCLDEYYRCIFIKVRQTKEVVDANRKAREIFGREDDAPFMPHLSLVYADMKAAKKRKIISSLENEVRNVGFEADSLHLYSTPGEPSEWYEEKEFSLG
jgi:2'-5' RNA ligase